MARHYDEDGDGRADHGQVTGHLNNITQDDWDAWRTETGPLSDDMVLNLPSKQLSDEYAHTHYVAGDDFTPPVEDGENLREFTENGEVDQGRFGDGNFVPPHWWGV